VPADHCFGIENLQRDQQIGCEAIEASEHEPIDVVEHEALGRLALQHIELMTKNENFSVQRSARPEQPGHNAPNQPTDIGHNRRRILHFNVTRHPTSLWIVQQLREAFPFEAAPRLLIFDRGAKCGLEVPKAVRALKMDPVRTSFETPWQNGVAERWVESCRRDLLNQVIAVNERHLRRLLAEYVRYYHEDRAHFGLGRGTPNGRCRAIASGRILPQERLGRLHHRY